MINAHKMINNTNIYMKNFAFLLFFFASLSFSTYQGTDPWTQKQLMEPVELADIINKGTTGYYIYGIGPAAFIKNSVEIGEGRDKKNIQKLKKAVIDLPKDANIVIYCGCCPFADCPNVRPAFELLNQMKFTNHKLLNLSQNFKVDWLDKGYPVNE